MSNEKKFCPIRMLVVALTPSNSPHEAQRMVCLGDECAWWNQLTDEYGACAIIEIVHQINSIEQGLSSRDFQAQLNRGFR